MSNLNKKFVLTCLYGDEEIYKMIAEEFVAQTTQRESELLSSIKEKDFDRICREAHTLKGLFTTFGASCFAETAKQLEIITKEKDIDLILELSNKLVEYNRILSNEIKLDLEN